MCLALLPLLGPYTREQPRRPKGGPDGGRDIEALFEGATVVWAGVGFRNGGGNDDTARKEADAKYRGDLKRMLEENDQLRAFVFFTNVDLPPSHHDELKSHARSLGMTHAEIFDFERLRHVLDSPEGLIARLQYLGIPMSPTEQAALVSKFGRELQRVVTTRLDRVERTLSDMEHFMAFQKPIFRVEVFVELTESISSADLGDQALLFHISGLRDLNEGFVCFCRNDLAHAHSQSSLVFQLTTWTEGGILPGAQSLVQQRSTASANPKLIIATAALSMLRVGSQYVRLIDLLFLRLQAICTAGIHQRVKRIAIDVNGYELFKCSPDSSSEVTELNLPKGLAFDATKHRWISLVQLAHRDCFFNPPRPSGRLQPLTLTVEKVEPGSAGPPALPVYVDDGEEG